MAIITEKDLQPTYDVIVVGSGAGGGQSAYTLTMNGVKVIGGLQVFFSDDSHGDGK